VPELREAIQHAVRPLQPRSTPVISRFCVPSGVEHGDTGPHQRLSGCGTSRTTAFPPATSKLPALRKTSLPPAPGEHTVCVLISTTLPRPDDCSWRPLSAQVITFLPFRYALFSLMLIAVVAGSPLPRRARSPCGAFSLAPNI